MNIDFQLVYTALPQLLKAAFITLEIATIAFALGVLGGSFLALVQTSNVRLLNGIIMVYVSIIRGTPMLIQITFFYYVLPVIGISLSPLWAATIAIGLNSSAYLSQIIGAGITTVGKEQKEAAQVLGFTNFQALYYIVMPQALRAIFPALISEWVTLIKDSSLASILGVLELYKVSRIIMNQTYDVVTVFCLVTLLYLLLTTTVEFFVRYIGRKMLYVAHR